MVIPLINGLSMAYKWGLLTTYKSWDDPPSGSCTHFPTKGGSDAKFQFLGLDLMARRIVAATATASSLWPVDVVHALFLGGFQLQCLLSTYTVHEVLPGQTLL